MRLLENHDYERILELA